MGEKVIAFDIGESQLKLVWYNGSSRKKSVCATLPENLVTNGEIVSMDAMADFIRETAKTNGIPKGNAAVILPATKVASRKVDVPVMTDAQLEYNLPYEFKDYLNADKSEHYFDYAVENLLKDEEDENKVKEMSLFACATLKKNIEDYRDMFRRAGFNLKIAIPEEIAYSALLSSGAKAESDTCFVDIGYNEIRMYFFKEDIFSTKRSVNIGVRDLVAAISESRGVTPQMAFEHMRSDYENALSQTAAMDLYHNMAVEIMKAVNFYNYNNRAQKLSRIYLCGGGAAIEPLRGAISELTDMEVLSVGRIMPEGESKEGAWLYAKAVGCALEALMSRELLKKSNHYPTKRTVNLAQKESHKQSVMTLTIGGVAIVVLAFCVAKFAVIDQFARENEAASAYSAVHQQHEEMEEKLADYDKVEQEYHTYSRKWMTDGETNVSVDRMDVLDLIENHMMNCGTVKSVSVDENTVIVNMSDMNLSEISAMVSDVQKQDIVQSTELTIAETANSDEKLDFSVTITLVHEEEEEATDSDTTGTETSTEEGQES
jgi:type IV pilus assembly protein PilM